MMGELMKKGGHPGFFRSNLPNQENVVWIHPRYGCKSQIDVEELTRVEMLGREKMLLTYDFFKENVPGFESSFIVLSGPQLGTRGARRVHGDYMVTSLDLELQRTVRGYDRRIPGFRPGRTLHQASVDLHPLSCHSAEGRG